MVPTAVPLSMPPTRLMDFHDPRKTAQFRPAREVLVAIIIAVGASAAVAFAVAAVLVILSKGMAGGRWCDGVV